MKYATYNEYKPSPMAWLDQLPMHWNAASLRWMSKRYAGGTPDKGNEAYWEDGEIPWINSGAVNDGYITQPSELITREGFANSSAKWIPKDALVMALAGQGKTKGMVAQLGIPTTCNQSMAALIPDHRFAPRYLYYWLTANYQNIRNLAGGEARDGLNLEMLGSIPCPLPPVDEQQTIARFLDAKTAQIDALVAQKRQLIDKLKEKRQALIARTVTRGLPPEAAKAAGLEPNPEMQPANVEWLDEYPSKWSLVPLKHLAAIRYGIGEPPEYVDDGVPLIRATNVDAGFIRDKGLVRVNPEDIPQKRIVWLREGDIVVVRSGAYTADSARIPAEFAGSIAGFDMVVSPRKIESRFLAYAILSRYFKEGQLDIQKLRAAQPHLNAEELGSSTVCVPSEHEQPLIADFLDQETAHIDQLIELAEGVIRNTTEYRQALITSAVTGKIDVRELA